MSAVNVLSNNMQFFPIGDWPLKVTLYNDIKGLYYIPCQGLCRMRRYISEDAKTFIFFEIFNGSWFKNRN